MAAVVEKTKHLTQSEAMGALRQIEAVMSSDQAEAVLMHPHRYALFIDIDGTLLNIAPTPDAVRVPTGLVALLERLVGGLGGAVALLTGRPVADVDRLFAPLELITAGVHGTEIRRQRHGPIIEIAPHIPYRVVRAMHNIQHMSPGMLIERKGAGVAVHYRNARPVPIGLEGELAAIAAASGENLFLRHGRKVLEVLPRGFSKGTALIEIAAQAPFADRLPVMIGDDIGDEPALSAAEKLGGVALRVAGEHFAKNEADFDRAEAVIGWLGAFSDKLAEGTVTDVSNNAAGAVAGSAGDCGRDFSSDGRSEC